MLNEMGVYQHHDAIAGTAKQLVANDYANRLTKALKNNTEMYAQVIRKQVEEISGINGEWQMCDRTNGTYLNCPIATYSQEEGSIVNFALHNPSSLSLKMA
jgi:hypothetical protein